MRRVVLAFVLAISSFGLMVPANANTLCADGTISYSVGRGTCSWHGGIAGGSSRSKSYGYSDPFGSSSRSKSYGYSDPYGSSLNNKPRGYGSSSLSCSYLDRSRGRC